MKVKTWLATFILCAAGAFAQTPQPPYALFQQATITGSNNTITATQIPVITASGVVVYLNTTIQFDVDANGNLTISAGFPQTVAAPATITSNLRAGRYVSPSNILNGKGAIILSGPGLTDGGATMWTISAAPNADPGTYPSTASFYVGPIANNPLASHLTQDGVTSTAFSYGIVGGGQLGPGGQWGAGSIIGVSQSGNTLTIALFNNYKTPQDQITYTLAPGQ